MRQCLQPLALLLHNPLRVRAAGFHGRQRGGMIGAGQQVRHGLQLATATAPIMAPLLHVVLVLVLQAALQFPLPALQPRQLCLHRQQLAFAKSFHLPLDVLQLLDLLVVGFGELLPLGLQGLLFLVVLPLARHQVFTLATGRLPQQHQLLLAGPVQLVTQLLITAGLLAVALQPLAADPQFRLHNTAALFMVPHVRELAAALLNALVKQRHTRQFVNDFPAFAATHGHNAGDIPLHHHVAAGGVDAETPQLNLQLAQAAGLRPNGIGAAVGAARGQPNAAGDHDLLLLWMNPRPGALLPGVGFNFRGLPVAEGKRDADRRFGSFALPHHAMVNQVRQALRTHTTAGGQPQAKKDAVNNVTFAGAIGSGDDSKSRIQRNLYAAAKGLEATEFNLLNVNQWRPNPPVEKP